MSKSARPASSKLPVLKKKARELEISNDEADSSLSQIPQSRRSHESATSSSARHKIAAPRSGQNTPLRTKRTTATSNQTSQQMPKSFEAGLASMSVHDRSASHTPSRQRAIHKPVPSPTQPITSRKAVATPGKAPPPPKRAPPVKSYRSDSLTKLPQEIYSPKSSQTVIDGTHMFTNSSHFTITGGVFNNITRNDDSLPSYHTVLQPLYKAVASNAILNAGGRADEARCHPGTRTAIIQQIEDWAADARKNLAPPIFWLSGPAGAGKTAIVQTITERLKEAGNPQINFFFYRTDSSRNTITPFVPTLGHQLLQLHPEGKKMVASLLQDNPLAIEGQLEDQIVNFLRAPLRDFEGSDCDSMHPTILIVDALDECDLPDAQRRLIRALGSLVKDPASPFLVFISSRSEHHIEMEFHALAGLVKSTFLDETYAPEDDIRRFITDEFYRIKDSHRLGSTLPASWPTSSDISHVVQKSSGQFIYAASVVRFLVNSPSSPALSLRVIHGIAPMGKASPFANLDALYTYVLSQVDSWEATRDMIALSQISCFPWDTPSLKTMFCAHRRDYSPDLLLSCASGISTLARFQGDDLTFYHLSFIDFLSDKTRSGEYWIDFDGMPGAFLEATWSCDSKNNHYAICNIFASLKQTNAFITHACCTLPPPKWLRASLFESIATVYRIFQENKDIYASVMDNFSRHGAEVEKDDDGVWRYAGKYSYFDSESDVDSDWDL